MSALQIPPCACRISKPHATPIHSFHASTPAFFSQNRQRSLFPYTLQNLSPISISSPTFIPQKRLLCRPPLGKHVREDYLVKKLSATEVQELVKGERNVPIIIDFYATWCGPCILMAQQLEMIDKSELIEEPNFISVVVGEWQQLAVEYESNAVIIKVDTDDEYEFARDMQVRGLPTLYFISPDPNKDAIRTEGIIPIQMMRNIIDNDM